MYCSDEEKFGCIMSLLDREKHRWWNTVKRGTTTKRLTWDYFLEVLIRVTKAQLKLKNVMGLNSTRPNNEIKGQANAYETKWNYSRLH
ncbi:hypothetical protein Gotur_018598 [Gossypium turneri]